MFDLKVMTHDLAVMVELMRKHGIAELKYGSVYAKLEPQIQEPSEQELAALEKLNLEQENNMQVSDEDILMDPYAGLNSDKRKTK